MLQCDGGLKLFLHIINAYCGAQCNASILDQAKLSSVDSVINWKQKLASGFICVFISAADQSSTT